MLPADLADALRVLGPALAATAALFRALPALVTAARRRSASHHLPSPAILTDYSGVAPWARKTQWPQGWATDPEVRRQGWRTTRIVSSAAVLVGLIGLALVGFAARWLDSPLFLITAVPLLFVLAGPSQVLLRSWRRSDTATTLHGHDEWIVVQGEPGSVWQFCVAATRGIGGRLVQVDSAAGEIVAATGIWAGPWTGQCVRVSVRDHSHVGFLVRIRSDVISHMESGVFMSRSNRRNVERFLDSWGSAYGRVPDQLA